MKVKIEVVYDVEPGTELWDELVRVHTVLHDSGQFRQDTLACFLSH